MQSIKRENSLWLMKWGDIMSIELAPTISGAPVSRWKQYPAYRDSGVEWLGEVPEGWKILPLRRVVYRFVDYRGKTPEKVDRGVPLITAKNIKGGHIDLSSSKEFIRKNEYQDWMTRGLPENGDVLITTEAPLGEVAQVESTYIALAQRIILLKVNKSIITNSYLKYHFLSKSGQGELWTQSSGSTALGIKADRFKGTLVSVPSLPEQRAIAAFLDSETGRIDTLIEKKERQVELLQEKRAALISHAVTKGLDPDVKMKDSGVEWLGEIPEHWKMLALKRLASLKSGEFITAESIDKDGDYPVFGGNGLRGYTTTFTHDGNYVLIGRQGALCGNINYAQGLFWASEHAVVVSHIKPVETKWLGELLRAMNLNQYSVSAAQPGLSVEMISNLSIPQPPLQEQSTIATFLNRETGRIDTLTTKIRESLSKLREYRTALISAAVTGKIDVREDLVS
jgi:type I restriction enzyme, S subunit